MKKIKHTDASKSNIILTLICWVVFACVAMGAMLFVASDKTIVIADSVGEQNTPVEAVNHTTDEMALILTPGDEKDHCIRIPLEKGTKAERVTMENHYTERELWIYLQHGDKDFYEENGIGGDLSRVEDGCVEVVKGSLILKLKMNGVLEYHSTMENDALVVAFYDPHELYDHVVIVDPVKGGNEYGIVANGHTEKEIVLQVAKQLQKKQIGGNVKVYFTRLEDKDVTAEERLALVEEVKADLFIGISVCEENAHPEYYGIHSYYNEAYFIPEFGNLQLADVLTKNVTISASNKAVGLTPAAEDSILRKLEIPAAEVCVGYMSNLQECTLLGQAAYQQKLAEGIEKAIVEVCTGKK